MKYYIGIDLGGTNIVAGVVNEAYEILAKASVKTNLPRPEQEIAADMAKVAKEAAEKGMQVFVLGVGSPDGSPIPAENGSNNFRRDKDGNVIVTRLNEQMCQEIAKAGNGMYIRVDNTNSAEKVLNNEIAKLSKADVESQVYTEFDEQFQALAWLVLILLVVEMLILERKNPLFKNVRLFK